MLLYVEQGWEGSNRHITKNVVKMFKWRTKSEFPAQAYKEQTEPRCLNTSWGRRVSHTDSGSL